MMPEFFSETETNTGATEAKKVKKLLFWSYALKVASLLFVVLSAVFSPYYLIGFAIFMMSGIALKQSVLERTASFEYFFVRDTLKITAFSNFGKKKYEISIPINDIVSIEREFERIPEAGMKIYLFSSVFDVNFLPLTPLPLKSLTHSWVVLSNNS